MHRSRGSPAPNPWDGIALTVGACLLLLFLSAAITVGRMTLLGPGGDFGHVPFARMPDLTPPAWLLNPVLWAGAALVCLVAALRGR